MHYYLETPSKIIENLQTDAFSGLSFEEAKKRQHQQGPNQIQQTGSLHPLLLFLEQFNNPLTYILLGAAGFSFYLKEYNDGIVLTGIVVANAIFGFYQEWQASNVLASLKSLVVEKCQVIREGKILEINSKDLVTGDIVCLEEGDGVPADMRLLESHSLATNDFILTGESVPVEKSADNTYHQELPLSSQHNCVFMGTTVARGTAKALVFAIGKQTQMGNLASRSQEIQQTASPLQKQFAYIARRIIMITAIIAVSLFLIRYFTNNDFREAIVFAIGVAAAMVPEGLPAQISVSLALGMGRLAKKNAVVKKLAAIETLGSATVIASDKTGTITKNQMTITQCIVNGRNFTISGLGYNPTGDVLDTEGNKISEATLTEFKEFFLSGYLASTAHINPPDDYHKTWYAIGDPTEAAFAVLARKMGFEPDHIENEYPKIQIFPFDSFRKRISIVRDTPHQRKVFCKGALESVLPICSKVIDQGQVNELTEKEKHTILENSHTYASQGLRIIALAYKEIDVFHDYNQENVESDLIFIGFAMMYDPPHAEVRQAIEQAFKAHMKIAIITGDNEITAKAIASQIGMMNENDHFPEAISGSKLQGMSDEEIYQCFEQRAVIFSRVSPDDKLRVVEVLKQKGEIVAVTGDGVNDTLSLKKADIGVAMGMNGSKVAQEAANMVLLNDDFSTIVVAIREGRTIYKNLEKTILVTISANVAELSCVLIGFLGAFWEIPIPILAIQILMIDLVGEIFPLLMLTFDPPEENIMLQPPRPPGAQMLNAQKLSSVIFAGLVIGILSYGAFLLAYLFNEHTTRHYEACLTVSYVSIILGQYINILGRRTRGSIFSDYFFSNPRLLLGFGMSFACVLLTVYLPFFNKYLRTAPLLVEDWAVAWLVPLGFLIIHELRRKKYEK